MFVCLFSIEIQTTGQNVMKFAMEEVLEGEGSWAGFDSVPPTPASVIILLVVVSESNDLWSGL